MYCYILPTSFSLNVLLHSRAFLRFALVVESHLCLHASVNCNTLRKRKKERKKKRHSFWDTEPCLTNVNYCDKVKSQSQSFDSPQIFWVFFKVAPFSSRFSGPRDLHNHISTSISLYIQKLCSSHTLLFSKWKPGRRAGIHFKIRSDNTLYDCSLGLHQSQCSWEGHWHLFLWSLQSSQW